MRGRPAGRPSRAFGCALTRVHRRLRPLLGLRLINHGRTGTMAHDSPRQQRTARPCRTVDRGRLARLRRRAGFSPLIPNRLGELASHFFKIERRPFHALIQHNGFRYRVQPPGGASRYGYAIWPVARMKRSAMRDSVPGSAALHPGYALPHQLPHRPIEPVESQGIHPPAHQLAHHADRMREVPFALWHRVEPHA